MELFSECKTTCPNCQKKSWWLKHHKQMTFCPYCKIVLYQNYLFNNDLPKFSQPLAFAISLAIFIVVFVTFAFIKVTIMSVPIGLIVIAMIMLALMVWLVYKKPDQSQQLIQGVDTLEQIKSDSCDYAHSYNHKLQCLECQSFRIVDQYWYKRILAKNNSQLPPIITLADQDSFAGCVHCHAQYEVQPPLKRPFIIPFLYISALLFMFVNAFVADNISSQFYGLFLAIMIAVYLYHGISEDGYFTQASQHQLLKPVNIK